MLPAKAKRRLEATYRAELDGLKPIQLGGGVEEDLVETPLLPGKTVSYRACTSRSDGVRIWQRAVGLRSVVRLC